MENEQDEKITPKQEGNPYDKMFKENILAIFLPVLKQYFGLEIMDSEALDTKLQKTIEREVDFLRLVKTKEGEEFILHLEFQSGNDGTMLYRMKEYDAIIHRKHKKKLRHYVIYLGQQKMTMQTRLNADEIFTGFEVLNISTLDCKELVALDIPEAVVLAILSDFKGIDKQEVIQTLVENLKRLSHNPKELEKFITQLKVFSKLRNLEGTIIKTLEDMSINYDITKDYVYNVGLEVGLEKGVDKERAAQAMKERLRIIEMLLEGVLSLEQIAYCFKRPIGEIEAIQQEIIDKGFKA